jgi:hypothetical protein
VCQDMSRIFYRKILLMTKRQVMYELPHAANGKTLGAGRRT